VVNGVLNDTAVTFELTVPGADPNFMTWAFGCTYVSGDRIVTGTLVSNRLEAQATTVMDCPNDGRVTLQMRVAGAK
jgi:hypothetical protein